MTNILIMQSIWPKQINNSFDERSILFLLPLKVYCRTLTNWIFWTGHMYSYVSVCDHDHWLLTMIMLSVCRPSNSTQQIHVRHIRYQSMKSFPFQSVITVENMRTELFLKASLTLFTSNLILDFNKIIYSKLWEEN